MDGVPGIAVLMVLLYHLKEALASDLHVHAGRLYVGINTFSGAGFMGVEVFFFISGFVLFYPYARTLFEGKPLQTVAHFANRRALKILPSYLVSLTFMTIVLVFALPRSMDSWVVLEIARNYGVHLLFAHSIFKSTFFALNGPLWSLAGEVQFYLIFPLAAWAFRRWALATPLLLVAISEGYRLQLQVSGGASDSFYVYQLPGFLDLFAFGMGSAYLIVMFRERFAGLTRWSLLFTAISVLAAVGLNAMFFSLAHAGGGPGAWHWQNTFRSMFGALLAIFAVSGMLGAPSWQKVVANPVFVYLAFISYNLYLWNKFVILWVRGHVLSYFAHWPHAPLISIWLPVAAALLIAIVATYAIERPFLDSGWSILPLCRTASKRSSTGVEGAAAESATS
jgi:peptidoglycan/LPS O-acetylase OafA/YrhL